MMLATRRRRSRRARSSSVRWPAARAISPPVRLRSCAPNWGAPPRDCQGHRPLLAAADTDDEHHARSVALVRRTPRPLLVPLSRPDRSLFHAQREKGTRAEAALLRSISTGQISLIPLDRQDLDRMVELVEKYSDFPIGAVDASVLAITERLDADAIATLDRRHFSVVRLTKPVALLP